MAKIFIMRRVAMPGETDLPASIARLAFRRAAHVDAGVGFRMHIDGLIRGLQRLLKHGSTAAESGPQARVEPRVGKVPAAGAGTARRAERGPPKPSEPPRQFESDRLLTELKNPKTDPKRRLQIGDRLAELGDPRPGVGLRPDGLPDIDWVEIPDGGVSLRREQGAKASREFPDCPQSRHPCPVPGLSRCSRWLRGRALVEGSHRAGSQPPTGALEHPEPPAGEGAMARSHPVLRLAEPPLESHRPPAAAGAA